MRHFRPSLVALVIQTAQVGRRGRDTPVPQEHGHVLDGCPGLSAQLRRCVPQHMRRDPAEAGRLAVPAQVGVQRRV